MITKRNLSTAPIKEALIDIHVALPEKVGIERLNSGYLQISDRYPTSKTLHRGEFRIDVEGSSREHMAVASSNNIGYRYISDDRQNIVQFRIDGFTFSQLEYYSSWEDLKQEAVRLWEVYSNSVSPSLIPRIATRYINLLKLPQDSDIEEYLAAPPKIPDGVDQNLSGFLTRIRIERPSIGAKGIVTQGWDDKNYKDMTVLLDIEVYIEKEFDPRKGEFWNCFDQLREFKNDIFFNSITEKTVRKYE